MRQRQYYSVAGDIVLIKLLRFRSKLSKSLKKWVATQIDQV